MGGSLGFISADFLWPDMEATNEICQSGLYRIYWLATQAD